jgi:MFS family permease
MKKFRVDKTVFHLQAARTLRSISQGIAVVDLALYLKELHWSATAIGGVLSAAGITGAALILIVGIVSDHVGRKPFLLIYEFMTAIAALLMTITANPYVLSAIIVITGFGRGQSGAAGPFTPAEQAWLTAHVPRENRGRVFSVNTGLGFFGMSAGALLAGTTGLWSVFLPGVLRYRPLFFLMFLFSIGCALIIATAPAENQFRQKLGTGSETGVYNQVHRGQQGQESLQDQSDSHAVERHIRTLENRNMAKLAAVNMINGLAIGFMGPLMSYWFSVKFGVSAAEIGLTLSLTFAVTGISSFITGELAQRFGMVKSVVWLQILGVLMMCTLPLLPTFWLASLVYIVRSALSRGTQGARSALSASLTRDHRRGFSVSMNSLAMRLTSSIGPTLSGYMMEMDALSLPFYVASGLQFASTLLYGRLFRHYDNKDVHGRDEYGKR